MIVHIILNSHLDPVWLWRKSQGIDEVLATARTACDILDRFPQVTMTRGEAWFYETVERLAPELFQRIARHIAQGRWKVVGGWYIQPDCNLASASTYHLHGQVGQRYFQERFGCTANTGYNVDSFGHSAFLPEFLNAAGMTNYVMMRPQPHEKQLPANDFIWKSPGGAAVRTFRIATAAYNASLFWGEEPLKKELDKAIAQATPGLGHTMFFLGVGDHGGGPTINDIQWILEHQDYAPGVRLEFSHPDAYFAATAATGFALPQVTGELQYHAIGCYSANSRIKREFRETENILAQAEMAGSCQLEEERKKLLFASFHDVLPGSAIPVAFQDIYDDLGAVRSRCQEILVDCTRKANLQLPPGEGQRLIFNNFTTKPFKGMVEVSPWIGYDGFWKKPRAYDRTIALTDEAGQSVPWQFISAETPTPLFRIALNLEIPAGGQRIITLQRKRTPSFDALKQPDAPCEEAPWGIAMKGVTRRIRCAVLRDVTDTWSHGIDHYPASAIGYFQGEKLWMAEETHSLRRVYSNILTYQSDTLYWKILHCNNPKRLEFRLRLRWNTPQRMVKLEIPAAFPVTAHHDMVPGGWIERPCTGKEYPFRQATILKGQKKFLAVISNDCFSADIQPNGKLRLTLLRTPYYGHHIPNRVLPGQEPPVMDLGSHEFRIVLIAMDNLDLDTVEGEAHALANPPIFSETTNTR